MKKFIIFIVLISVLKLAGCRDGELALQDNNTTGDQLKVANTSEFGDKQNDLVFRDYGSVVRLTTDSQLYIPELYLDLKGVSAQIEAVNMKSKEVILIGSYHPDQSITFQTDKDGIYKIIAVTDSGRIINLSSKASIGVISTSSKNYGSDIIELK